ncbi:sigma-70 family RNA polymerase sigma factor, partial [Nostoc sp. CENA67]|nr:sigma-70 family RNA polymerase sigma factor [Amazonocrinis nigriterrae CENA67]
MIQSSFPSPSGERFAAALETCRQFLLTVAAAEMPDYLTPKGGASDLVQNTLANAYLARARFCGRTLDELRAWLRGILANELADFRRRYRAACRDAAREAPVDAADASAATGSQPIDHLIRAERAEAVAAAVERLPADARSVLALRLDCGLGFREIGEHLGRTEEAARKVFLRALERLRATAPEPAEPDFPIRVGRGRGRAVRGRVPGRGSGPGPGRRGQGAPARGPGGPGPQGPVRPGGAGRRPAGPPRDRAGVRGRRGPRAGVPGGRVRGRADTGRLA